jgi:hypothetical protein
MCWSISYVKRSSSWPRLRLVEANDQPANRLVLQPNLAGTGGRFAGELDTLGMAILDQTTAPRREQLRHPGGTAGARADNLLTRLVHHHTVPAPAAQRPTVRRTMLASRRHGTPAARHRRWRRGRHRRRRRRRRWWGVGGGTSAGAGWRVAPAGEAAGPGPARNARPAAGGAVDPPDRWAATLTAQRRATCAMSSRCSCGWWSSTKVRWSGSAVRPVRRPAGSRTSSPRCTTPAPNRCVSGPPARPISTMPPPWWPEGPDQPYGTTDADNLGPLCGPQPDPPTGRLATGADRRRTAHLDPHPHRPDHHHRPGHLATGRLAAPLPPPRLPPPTRTPPPPAPDHRPAPAPAPAPLAGGPATPDDRDDDRPVTG